MRYRLLIVTRTFGKASSDRAGLRLKNMANGRGGGQNCYCTVVPAALTRHTYVAHLAHIPFNTIHSMQNLL